MSAAPARKQIFKRKQFWEVAAALLALAALMIAGRFLPLGEWLKTFTHWAENQGAIGGLLLAASYVAGTVLLLPGSVFTIAAGVGFGLFWGTILSTLSATAGAAIAFLVARYLARKSVAQFAQRHEGYKKIDTAIGKKGWKIVFLIRLNPIFPFSFSNYFFGVTKVRFWPYVFATMTAILPGTLLYVYLGHIGRIALVERDRATSTEQMVLLGVGLVVTIAVSLYLAGFARKALASEEEEN